MNAIPSGISHRQPLNWNTNHHAKVEDMNHTADDIDATGNTARRREGKTSRRRRQEKRASLSLQQQQQPPQRHHSDHGLLTSPVDDEFAACAMIELERASTDAAAIGDNLVNQQLSSFRRRRTSLFTPGTTSSSSGNPAFPSATATNIIESRISDTPITPPEMILNHRRQHRRRSSYGGPDSAAEHPEIFHQSSASAPESPTGTSSSEVLPGAYNAQGPPFDVSTWILHQSFNNSENDVATNMMLPSTRTDQDRRRQFAQSDRMSSRTFGRWLNSQQGDDESGDEERSLEFSYDPICDDPIEANVAPATIYQDVHANERLVMDGSQQTFEQSFNSIPPEYRPVIIASTTAPASSSSSDDDETNTTTPDKNINPKHSSGGGGGRHQRKLSNKGVGKFMKKVKKVTKEVTKEIVDMM